MTRASACTRMCIRARAHTRSHTHQGVDLGGLCLQQQQTPDTSPAPGATGSLIPQDGSAYAESYMDIQGITDCTVLETVVDHACAFKTRLTSVRRGSAGIEMDTRADNGQKGRQTPPREAASSTSVRRGSAGAASSAASTAAAPSSSAPAGWGASMNTHVRASRGYTLEFWMKIDATTRIPENNGDYQANPTSMRRLVFFSRVSPPGSLQRCRCAVHSTTSSSRPIVIAGNAPTLPGCRSTSQRQRPCSLECGSR